MSRSTEYTKNKERFSYTVYEDFTFPKDAAVGDTCEMKESTTYGNDDQMLYYTVHTYKAYEFAE